MFKKLLILAAAAASLACPALAADAPTQPTPPEGALASRGGVNGYVVPTAPGGNPGAQAGTNWTSRSGNTNIGGYAGGNTGGGYEGGARVILRW